MGDFGGGNPNKNILVFYIEIVETDGNSRVINIEGHSNEYFGPLLVSFMHLVWRDCLMLLIVLFEGSFLWMSVNVTWITVRFT